MYLAAYLIIPALIVAGIGLSLLIGYQHLLLLVIGFYLLSAALLRRRPAHVMTRAEEQVPVAAGGEW